ncbi:MAG: choice-of-anchor Q domain-containing protein [Thermodesulfobacteriota bacterium]|nr:choice-of-anchor Q domain-containing protein [Thermodesulfobacteriota bacterium]
MKNQNQTFSTLKLSIQTILFISCMSFADSAEAADIYVAPAGGGNGSIGSPADLQSALDTAGTNGEEDSIYLQSGIYDAGSSGASTFEYGSGSNDGQQVTLSGGWDSSYLFQTTDETLTVLDGGGDSRVLNINADGVSFDFSMAYLTIQNGYVDDAGNYGAGLRAYNSASGSINLMVSHCLFQNNRTLISADNIIFGGAMYTNCYFEVTGSKFVNNQAFHGGAMFINDVAGGDRSLAPKIDMSEFKGNHSGDDANPGKVGGTIFYAVSPVITNSVFEGPDITTIGSYYPGSGIASDLMAGTLTMINCVLSGFHTDDWGGAVSLRDTNAEITNCLFYDNHCGYGGSSGGGGGGAISIDDSTVSTPKKVTITNSTFVGNKTHGAVDGGAVYNRIQEITVINSIFWDNGTQGLYNELGAATASYCDIQGGTTGTNFIDGGSNIKTDPLFVEDNNTDPNVWDLHLTAGSPCMDAGHNNLAPQLTTTDLDNKSRINDGNNDSVATVNMGAYEFAPGLSYSVSPGSDSDCSDFKCTLQAAMDAAELDGTHSLLRLAQGTYNGNFLYLPAAGAAGDIEIQGGWNADFSSRTVDPANTILDGNSSGGVLKFNDYETSTVSGSIKVEGITVKNGKAVAGGGIYAFTVPPGSIELNRNIMENNEAQGFGGGCAVACGDWTAETGGSIILADNIIHSNRATGYMAEGNPGNGDGGGCGIVATSKARIANNLVYNNSAGTSNIFYGIGGGLDISLVSGEAYLINNTITGNQVYKEQSSTDGGGGGIVLETSDEMAWGASNVFIYNSIIYDNHSESSQGAGDIVNNIFNSGASAGSSLEIHYSDYGDISIGGVTPTLTNNIHIFPYFSTKDSTLYYLTNRSQCVDAGFNVALNMPIRDLAGQDRPQDGNDDGTSITNMGCYEQVVTVPFYWSMFLPAVIGGDK